MSDLYRELLEATILHLQDSKTSGVRFVSVSPETLAALNQPARTAPMKPVAPAPRAVQPAPTPAPALTPQPKAATELSLSLPGEAVATPRPGLSPEAKVAAFADLRQRALACVRCPHLASSRRNVV